MRINLRALILIVINSLIVLVILMLSFTFYQQFSKVLDDRILKQLNSIKTLKQIQVENLIEYKWNTFKLDQLGSNAEQLSQLRIPDSVLKTSGVYDFTPYNVLGKSQIGMVLATPDTTKIRIIEIQIIKDLLLERAGMGSTGESYIVGSDFYMRSQSRFLPKQKPSSIQVKTQGSIQALAGKSGRGLFKDYRGVEVYSVYSPIQISKLRLALLSEIDISEVKAPLKALQKKLITLNILILIIAIILSLFLTNIITKPIENMRKSLMVMASGSYNKTTTFSKYSSEMHDMFDALDKLKESLQGAVTFSNDIGKMNVNTNYEPKSEQDVLGISLLKMRDRLIKFRNNENKNRIVAKRQLVDGLENERRRLSRELHDGIGPLLTSLKFYIENHIKAKNQKLEMIRILDTTISEIRLMSNALMPSTIDDFGVGVALTNFVNNIKKTSGISIEFEDLTNEEISKITKNQSINIFRIGQELVNNALKHSQAENIRISLSEFDEFISLFYYDDGIGFDLKKVTLGSGIINIKERVEICNGDIQIHSKTGNTTIEIELPIDR